jgi:hypothetical protein
MDTVEVTRNKVLDFDCCSKRHMRTRTGLKSLEMRR